MSVTIYNPPVISPLDVTNAAVSGTPGLASQINTGDPNTKGLVVKGNTYTPPGVLPNSVSGLTAWYKADAIVGLNDGDVVSTWEDSGSNNYDISAAGGARPEYKTNILNGKSVVRFTSTKYMNSASFANLTQPFTVIFVASSLGDAGTTESFFCDQSGNVAFQVENATNKLMFWAGGQPKEVTGSFTRNVFWIVVATFNNASSLLWTNGESRTLSAGGAGATALSAFQMSSADYPLHGDIAEFIVYSGSLSTANRQGLEAYLADKYAVSVSSQTPQAEDLMEFQSSAGAQLSAVDASGRFVNATVAGAPTGTPANGTMVYDRTNNKLYVYNSGWVGVTLA